MLPVPGLVLPHSLTSGALMLSFGAQRGKRSGLCPADLHTFTELGQAADNKLFRTVLFNSNHVLHSLMPEKSNVFHYHNLRPRLHDRLLPDRTDQLINCNFINRVLYVDIY